MGKGRGRERGERRGVWRRVMGTVRLCKTKERAEDEGEGSMVAMKQAGWQQRRKRCAEIR